MELKQAALVIADISGYTRFMKFHSMSLVHAEEIITELLEAVIDSSSHPLTLNKLEGDAALFCADSDDPVQTAQDVFQQVRRFFTAFKQRSVELSGAMSLCHCEACVGIPDLKLKAFLHQGQVAFKRVKQFEEIAGENVIILHRLLKNSVPSDEYILMTDSYYNLIGGLQDAGAESRVEEYGDIGPVGVKVLYLDPEPNSGAAPGPSFVEDVRLTTRGGIRLFLQAFGIGARRRFNHLADQSTTLWAFFSDMIRLSISQFGPGSNDRRR